MTSIRPAFRALRAYATDAAGSRAVRPPAQNASSRTRATTAQRGLWLIESLANGRTGYTVSHGYHFVGDLDTVALTTALQGLAARHDALRTRLELRGEELWQVVDAEARVDLALSDLRRSALRRPIEEVLADRLPEPMDLVHGPAWRAELITLADREFALVLHIHHAVNDAASMAVIERDLSALYDAALTSTPAPLAEAAQFVQFATTPTGDHAAAREFWAEELRGLAPPARTRPLDAEGRYEAAWENVDCTGQYAAAVQLAARLSTSPFVIILAAMHLAVSRQQGNADGVVGTTVSTRSPAYESAVGPFVNTLPLRLRIDPDWTVDELVGVTAGVLARALDHYEVPIEDVAAEYLPRSSRSAPAIPITLTSNTALGPGPALTGVTCRRLTLENRYCQRDLAVYLMLDGEAVVLRAVRNVRTHDAAEVQRILTATCGFLDAFGTDPKAPLREIGWTVSERSASPGPASSPAVPIASGEGSGPERARVRAVWSEVLEVSEDNLAEDFFDSGGGSIAAMRVAARLGVSVRQIFKLRTQSAIAGHLAEKGLLPK